MLQVPAFESKDGKYLQDGNAIAYYVANDQLRGKNDFEKAQVLQWICFAENEILPASCAWVFPILGIVQYDKKVSKKHLCKQIRVAEKIFDMNKFVVLILL